MGILIVVFSTMPNSSAGRLDRISFILFQITLFIAPVFFIPAVSVPFSVGKTTFILYGIIAATIVYLIARLKDGVFEAPKSLFYFSAGVLAIVYALSALFSANPFVSLAGTGLDLGTLSFFLPSLVLFALVPLLVKNESDILRSYATLLVAFLVIAIFHLVRLFFPDALSLGVFTGATSNFLGKWNDLGIFFGLSTILSLLTLERVTLAKTLKAIVYAVFVLSLVFLAIVNFTPVWITLAILSLVFFVYKLSFEREAGQIGARIPYLTLGVLIVSLLFIFAGSTLSGIIAESLGTSQLEVRPSWQATFEIAEKTLQSDPIFGVGPNRFVSEWLAHKPFGINNTLFWNVNFNYGIGFIPSFLVSTGALGAIAVLLFIGLFLKLAFHILLHKVESPVGKYLTISTLFASTYLWIFSFVYVPSASIWVLTVVFSGLFIAAARSEGLIENKVYSTIDKPAASFISVLLVILAIIGTASFAYFVTVKFAANTYFQKGILAVNSRGSIDEGEKYLARAIALSPSDTYYQSLTELNLLRLSNLFNDTKISQSEAQTRFQTILSAAIQSSQAAVKFDPTNYQNHIALGRVFEAVVPLNIEGSYDSAKKAYLDALAVNPESPEIYLMLARLEVTHKNNKAAKDYIVKAIEKKSDYADAIFLLSQIQVAENDVPNAINSVVAVATLHPNDPGIFFQLGLLYYSIKDYQSSMLAFERAVTLSSDYASARYFLGLSYFQVGKKAESLAQFREIQKTNPDNAEVKSIIANLEAGKSPFSGTAAPTNITKSELPIKQ
jgi:tetratricopeptide (TPR) repeat protein